MAKAKTKTTTTAAAPYVPLTGMYMKVHFLRFTISAVFEKALENKLPIERYFTLTAANSLPKPVSQMQIAQVTGIDKSTVSNMLLKAEKEGLVTTERVPDNRRMVAVELTPKGRALVAKGDAVMADIDREMASPATTKAAEEWFITVWSKYRGISLKTNASEPRGLVTTNETKVPNNGKDKDKVKGGFASSSDAEAKATTPKAKRSERVAA